VAVKGFSFTLTLTSKRYRYDVTAWFDAAANKWTTVDPYSGGSLHSVIRKIEEAARATP
jgi:protein-tyrosine-phosphatase